MLAGMDCVSMDWSCWLLEKKEAIALAKGRLRMHYSKFNFNFNCVADCDVDDNVGCAPGLTCGEDNCAQFHEIGEQSGFYPSSDCCEGKTPTITSAIKIELLSRHSLTFVAITAEL